MIYFIEYDAAGNVCHTCSDPMATIVPLVNRIIFKDANGNPLVDANGKPLSSFNSLLADPVGITADTFNLIQAGGGAGNFTYNRTTQTVAPKVPANVAAPAATPAS